MNQLDRLAVEIGKAEQLIASLLLFGAVLLARRFCRYLELIDKLEQYWLSATMVAYSKDLPDFVERRLRLAGYLDMMVLFYIFWLNFCVPAIALLRGG